MHLRAILILATTLTLTAEPLPWPALPRELARLLEETGLTPSSYVEWQQRHRRTIESRLADGAAEHIVYYLLQTAELGPDARLDPVKEARRYFDSLPPERRKPFLNGAPVDAAFSPTVQRRMDAFWKTAPRTERHRLLRAMGSKLGWQPERIMAVAFRFLVRLPAAGDVDALYQQRGLSADPYPPTMQAIAIGENKPEGRRPAGGAGGRVRISLRR